MSFGVICPVELEFAQRIRNVADRNGAWPAQWGAEDHTRSTLDPAKAPSIGYHLTLAYFGDSADYSGKEVREVSDLFSTAPFADTVCDVVATHLAAWEQNGQYAIVALVEGRLLSSWRWWIRNSVNSEYWKAKQTFAFRPHITLGYFSDKPEGMDERGVALESDVHGGIGNPVLMKSEPGAT